jgi:hypothetical protein
LVGTKTHNIYGGLKVNDMEKWLEFRVENEECKHEQDQYNGCPLCEIDEKDKLLAEKGALLEERAKAVDNCLIQIDELVEMLEYYIIFARKPKKRVWSDQQMDRELQAMRLINEYRSEGREAYISSPLVNKW